MNIPEKVKNQYLKYYKDSDNCIDYPFLSTSGYGTYGPYVNGIKVHYLMHRVAFQLANNIDLTSENIICHKCDNPACINPKHLFLGTHADNVHDKVNKGRQAKGDKNGRYTNGYHSLYQHNTPPEKEFTAKFGRKLSLGQVLEIKELIKANYKLTDISVKLNIPYNTIKDIKYLRAYVNI